MLADLRTYQATQTLYCAGGIEDQPVRWMNCLRAMVDEATHCDQLDMAEAREAK